MWTCSKCGRAFEKTKQPHSCRSVPLAEHFKHKVVAKGLFDTLVEQITATIGACRIISLPCCVHLFGRHDFLAALPKKDRLEIRFALDRRLDSPRLKQAVSISVNSYKQVIDVYEPKDINSELMGWLKEAYYL